MSQSVEYTAAGALIRYTDTAGDDVSIIHLITITTMSITIITITTMSMTMMLIR